MYANPHNDPYTNAILAGKAARMEAARAVPLDEMWKALEETSAHTRRAKAAYLRGRPAPKPPRTRMDEPKPSRQYVTMQTLAIRDARLSKTTVVVLAEICALSGATGYTDVTNAALGALVNRSRSTIKRAINEAVTFGYLETEILYTARGSVYKRRARPTSQAWPYWHPQGQEPEEPCGSISAPHITTSLKEESFEGDTVTELSTDDADKVLRAIAEQQPDLDEVAAKSNVTREGAINSYIRLVKTGLCEVVEGPEGVRIVPVMRKKRKKRLFRP
jgi:predicted transcriptional regulator